jgi:hypothetical protein
MMMPDCGMDLWEVVVMFELAFATAMMEPFFPT